MKHLLTLLLAATSASAQSLIWDPGHTPASPTGGNGTWRFNVGADWWNFFTDVNGLNGKFGLGDFAPLVNRVWNSGGTSDLWSDGANWTSHQPPVNGDSLTFGSGARTDTMVDYAALSVEEVTFLAGAPVFTIHVPEAAELPLGDKQLTINGALRNASGLEQTLVADGATGLGHSGVLTIKSGTLTGPFALVARGAAGGGPNGAVIEFSGAADGVSARVVTEPGTYFDFGARLGALRLGSIEGGGLFLMGSNSLSVGWNNFDTEFSGTLAGINFARLEKHGTGTLILSESNTYDGGTSVFDGTLVVTAPANQLGAGSVIAEAGGAVVHAQTAVAGFQDFTARRSGSAMLPGGVLRFRDTASAGRITMRVEGAAAGFSGGSVHFEGAANGGTSAAITVHAGVGVDGVAGTVSFVGTATAANASFTNLAGAQTNTQGGVTTFLENATAGSAIMANEGSAIGYGGRTHFTGMASADTSFITNRGVAGVGPLPVQSRRGRTEFSGSATAGAAEIHNLGSPASPGLGGGAYFSENATAGTALIRNLGSAVAGGGWTEFDGTASAGAATIDTEGAFDPAGFGGTASFRGSATAGDAMIFNRTGRANNTVGGLTLFSETSNASAATIVNERGTSNSTAGGGLTLFLDTASAGTSVITNEGGGDNQSSDFRAQVGRTEFRGASTAGAATITNLASVTSMLGGNGGETYFLENASAGAVTIVNEGRAVFGGEGGLLLFGGFASASAATITNRGGQSGNGGLTYFAGGTAGSATIVNESGGGNTTFFGGSAGSATITNRGADVPFGSRGRTTFIGTTAGSPMIVNESGTGENGRGGITAFFNGAGAGSATIVNRGPASAELGGTTDFNQSSAGTATITAEGSAVAGESRVSFFSDSSAVASTLTALGATGLAGRGGLVLFASNATAGIATLLAASSPVPGAPGGRLEFIANAAGGRARATVEAGATFDISGLNTAAGMSIGSIAGAGTFFLGSKTLTVGTNDEDTTVSGVLADGGVSGGAGGWLTKTGLGALTLDGANTYTGTTTVLNGTLTLNGSLADATIRVFGGVFNVNGDISGATVDVAPTGGPAFVNFSTSQQLDSLTIGDGGRVVLLAGAPSPGQAVPEPGAAALLLLGALVAAVPRRRAAM